MGCLAYSLANPERLDDFLKPTNQPEPKFWIPQFSSSERDGSNLCVLHYCQNHLRIILSYLRYEKWRPHEVALYPRFLAGKRDRL
jgi:hypothetical protein